MPVKLKMPIKKKKDESQKEEKGKKVDFPLEGVDFGESKRDLLSEGNNGLEDGLSPEVSVESSALDEEFEQIESNEKKESHRLNKGPVNSYNYNGSTIKISGILEILTDYGVIRQTQNQGNNDDDLPKDVYISHSQIKRFGLRMGDTITGLARPPKENERYLSLLRI